MGNMSKRERKEFDRKQKQLQREKDDDWLLGMLFMTDELDDMEFYMSFSLSKRGCDIHNHVY